MYIVSLLFISMNISLTTKDITYAIYTLGIPHNKVLEREKGGKRKGDGEEREREFLIIELQIYTHIGNTEGLFKPPQVGNGPTPALTPYALPGWSFYTYHTATPTYFISICLIM
jgi:hypothetical protein